jgi:hypothetical protein
MNRFRTNRRNFLKKTGMAAALPLLPGITGLRAEKSEALNPAYKKLDEILKNLFSGKSFSRILLLLNRLSFCALRITFFAGCVQKI